MPSNDITSPTPKLPLDLERTIFEMSALSRRRRIPNLMLVAHRVKTWVEPLMYRVVVLLDGHGGSNVRAANLPVFTYKIFSRLLASKPPDFLKKSVKYLFLGDDWSSERPPPEELLHTCTQVVDLFNFRGCGIGMLEALQCVQRIAIDTLMTFPEPSPSNFSHPVFRSITHLEIIAAAARGPELSGISHIPHLTHFAFNNAELGAFLSSSVFPACPRLRCIVLLHTVEMDKIAELLDDKRFVPMEQSRWVLDWQRGACGGVCYWDVADGFVRARQAGRVGTVTAFISNEDTSWLS